MTSRCREPAPLRMYQVILNSFTVCHNFHQRQELFLKSRTIIDMTLKDRYINIDDLGKVAWFIQNYDLKYQIGESVV